MRARYYQPGDGRFTSRDTWPYDFQNPVELNRYGYVANRPISFFDPEGLSLTKFTEVNLESDKQKTKTGEIGNWANNFQFDDAVTYSDKAVTVTRNVTVRNKKWTGKWVKTTRKGYDDVHATYGPIRYNSQGFPDFSPHSIKNVRIPQTGINHKDFVAANKAAGYGNGAYSHPKGYTWHHHQDQITMQLVPTRLHEAFQHTGGGAFAKAIAKILNTIMMVPF